MTGTTDINKSEWLGTRASEETRAKAELAARTLRIRLSEFIRRAVDEKASRVLSGADR